MLFNWGFQTAVITTFSVCTVAKYNFVEILTGEHPAANPPPMAPTLEVAYNEMLNKYPRLRNISTRSRINRPDITSCVTGEAEAIAYDVYNALDNSDGVRIIVSPGILT